MPNMNISGGRWVLPLVDGESDFSLQSSTGENGAVIATLSTTNKFVDKDIDIKLKVDGSLLKKDNQIISSGTSLSQGDSVQTITITKGYYNSDRTLSIQSNSQVTSAEGSIIANIPAPTVARTETAGLGTAKNVGAGSVDTSIPSTGYFISFSSEASTQNTTFSKTLTTPGYLSNMTSISTSANSTAGNYYLPITAGTATGGTASLEKYITDGSAAGINVTNTLLTSSISDSEPNVASTYYIAFTASGNSSISTAGWFETDDELNPGSAVKYIALNNASVTHGNTSTTNGNLSITNNYSGTPTVSASLTDQTTSGIALVTTEPSSGHYVTITSNSGSLSGTTKATRAAYTETWSKGYLPDKSAYNILNSTYVEPTVTINANSKTSYLTIPTASVSYTGGALNSKTASAEFANITTSSTDNGIYVQTIGEAGRDAITYTNTAGWLDAHPDATVVSNAINSSTWNGAKYYITGITVPKDKGFTITTIADNTLDTTSDLDITNAAYRRVDITNAANGSIIISNAGNITSTQSAKTGTIIINAYDTSSSSSLAGEKTIVENGAWKTTAASAATTYYGRVTVGAVNGTIGGTATSGSATAVITNTNSVNTINDLTEKTAGTDYWQIKATATGTAGGFKPKYTVNTAGWIASTVEASSNTTVSVSSDTTGQSIYIPRATFATSAGVVYCATAGYIPAGSASVGVATINNGTIGTSTTDPGEGYSENTETVVPSGGYLTLTAGYYAATKISLATLVPNGSNVAGHADYLLAGKTAYDNNGILVTGNIGTYTGTYTITTT